MNAVTSHRPHAEDGEYRRNQRLAKMAWDHVFAKMVYMGPAEQELASYNTVFIPSEPCPKIKEMAAVAASMAGYTAVLNADIVVNPTLNSIEVWMRNKNKLCASSRRWNFHPNKPKLVDMLEDSWLGDDRGRDIFVAHPKVWRHIAAEMPDTYRIGQPRWDAWMTDFFRACYNDRFIDFTESRAAFHPVHGNRKY